MHLYTKSQRVGAGREDGPQVICAPQVSAGPMTEDTGHVENMNSITTNPPTPHGHHTCALGADRCALSLQEVGLPVSQDSAGPGGGAGAERQAREPAALSDTGHRASVQLLRQVGSSSAKGTRDPPN